MNNVIKRFSAVFAFVFTMFTLLSNMPVKAAIKKTAIPEVQFASVPKTEYMAGDRIQFNIISPNYGGKVEYRVVLWDDAKKSYSDLWNEKNGYPNRYYTKWQPTGNTVFTLGWPITEPGNYRITVYAKRVGVASGKTFLKGMNCDSYKESAAFMVKPKVTLFDRSGQAYGSSDVNKPEAYKEDVKITAKDITLSNAKLEGNLYIAGDNAVIKNVSAAGKIVVDPGKEGIATLDNVTAKSIEVLSGGQNSIHIKDVKAQSMSIGSSTPVRIEVDGDTEIVSTSAEGYVIFDRKNGTFGTITITKGSNGDTVIEFRGEIRDRVEVETTATIKTGENSKVFNLVVNTGLVKLEGNYEKVEINSQAKVKAGPDTRLESIVAHEDAEIYLDKTAAVGSVDKGDNTVTIIKDGQTEPGSGTGDGGGGYIPPPAAISAVTVTGSKVVGQTLTAALTPANANAAYQWKRSDTIDGTYTDIAGATAKTYALTKDDAGKYIKVTAVGTGRYTGTRISGATEVIIGISVETFHILDINVPGFGVGVNQIVTLLGTTYADSDNANNWAIDTGTTNLQFLYITKIATNRVVITYKLKSAGQGTGVGTVTIKAKASAVAANRDTNEVSLVTTQNDANKAAAAKAAIEGADYTRLGVGDITDNAQKEAAIRAVVNGIKGETAALIYNLGPNYYVIISMNEAGGMADINPVTFASNKAELAGVAGLKDNTPGTQTGMNALNAIEWEISVDAGKSKLTPGDITASPNAAIKLYSNSTFTTEVNNIDGLALAGGHTTAYIKVTAEDGRTVKYYAVDIYRELPAQSGAPAFLDGTPAKYLKTITVGAGSLGIKTNLTYTWYRSDDAVFNEGDVEVLPGTPGGLISTYTPVEADIGKYLIVTASSTDADGIGIVSTTAVEKAENDHPGPMAEVIEPPTSTQIKLKAYSGCEYTIVTINGKPQIPKWEKSNIFTGLTSNTKYTFAVREKETSTHLAGRPGPVSEVIQTALPQQTGAPAFTAGTPATYGTPIIVGEGSLEIKTNLTYTWYRSDDAVYDAGDVEVKRETLAIGQLTSTYEINIADIGKYLIAAATSTDAAGKGFVATAQPVAKKQYSGEEAIIPTVSGSPDSRRIILTDLGITYEYAISSIGGTSQGSLNWQSSNVFTGLILNTEYKFKSRIRETETMLPSTPSLESSPILTQVVQGLAITGLNIPANVLQMGEAETRTASTAEAGAGNWTSSNPAVAEIDPIAGIVTAKAHGTTVIAYTTSNSGNVNSIPIEVYDYAVIDAPEIGEVRAGAGSVTPMGYINATAGQTIAWTSSDTSKATVNSSTGLITPVAPGSTTISYRVTETSTGRIAAKGQKEITVLPAKTVSIGDIDGTIMSKTTSDDRHYTVTTSSIADGQAAEIIWIDQFGNPNTAAPLGITITPDGPVSGGSLTLNVVVDDVESTYAGNYRFKVRIDGAESDIKTLTIGNGAIITGATLDASCKYFKVNACLIINLDKADSDSEFDISKFAYKNELGFCNLQGAYTRKDTPYDPNTDCGGFYYYSSSVEQLTIVLTSDDYSRLPPPNGSGTGTLIAAAGWNISHEILTNTTMSCTVTEILYD